MSTRKYSSVSLRMRSISARISSLELPSRAICAARMTSMPMPQEAERESNTAMSASRSSIVLASSADWYVPLNCEDRWMERIGASGVSSSSRS